MVEKSRTGTDENSLAGYAILYYMTIQKATYGIKSKAHETLEGYGLYCSLISC